MDELKDMVSKGKLKGIPGGLCITKPVFASDKGNVPVLLPDCSPLAKGDQDFELPGELKPKDMMVERNAARSKVYIPHLLLVMCTIELMPMCLQTREAGTQAILEKVHKEAEKLAVKQNNLVKGMKEVLSKKA